jgi:hypothetical protein
MSAVCSRGSVGLTTTSGEAGRPEGVVLGVLEEQAAALSSSRAESVILSAAKDLLLGVIWCRFRL